MSAPLLYAPGRIARLVFNRPATKNALNAECWALLADALTQFEQDADARVLVLSGADANFSSGADLGGGITDSADKVAGTMRKVADTILRLHHMPKPTVASVDGVAVGVAMSLALGCDFVIASDRARFGAVFSRIGLTPDGGLSWLLPRLVGPQRAKELALFGHLVAGDEAYRLGLVNTVVPVDRLAATTDDWCERLAGVAPHAAAGALHLLDDAWSLSFTETLEREAAAQQIAVAARRERQPATEKGRA
jgi:enoyl-CoA hydratase/carnithine racemase